ncbi:S1 RNA-binding domain-containing protein [Amycolatopsis sp. lyj-109]|uniref:S1 RNA-binding domain-containing protein n=1 Tax=Amycolatopsis sp. lyj-109 TaxID=2789287 RepID=UPI00397B8DDC
MGAAYVDLDPGLRPVEAGRLKAGRLGRLDRGERPHVAGDDDPPSIEATTFGITDDHIRQLLVAMDNHQVIVVAAPTGSGKSTFLPWRLLNPPAPHPKDAVTRHGTIVVTQPRIEATQGIPRYIGEKLHGARVGAGLDIGFRHSSARDQADSRNRLVYATDGTLVNMVRRGELAGCSVIIIDEAHERSLNIDLILALMRRELIALPQLRLLIVSATIDAAAFARFFQPEIRTTAMAFPGKEGMPVHDRWRPDSPLPESQWPARMPGEVARVTHEVLRWMASGERPGDIPGDVPLHDGDILAFLPGKRAINAAIDELDSLVDEDSDLAGQVEVLPLYAELSETERARALKRARKRKGTRWRVIVATNIAETSLTVDGVRHVIDSGLINTTEWDVSTLTTVVRPRPHSKSGLRQRRGRAGRTAPGVWHCLFTKAQFDALEFETPPEIVRAPLENIVLAAAAAGVSDPASLRWMPPGPPEEEMRRAAATLRGMGALTEHGDPTVLGNELASSRESFSAASVLLCADEAGVAIEAATVLAAMQDQRWTKLLRWSSAWSAATRVRADRLLAALCAGCADDLDVTLLLVHEWEAAEARRRPALADRYLLSGVVLDSILRRRAELLQSLQSRTKTCEVRDIDLRLGDRLRRVIAWTSPNAIYRDAEGEWQPALVPRADPDVVARLHDGARPAIGSGSLLSRRPSPPFVVAPVRDRRRHWVSPLQEPVDRVTLAFCVALEEHHLAGNVPLLAHVAGHQHGAVIRTPVVLPGDRLLVEPVGPRKDGLQVRALTAQPPLRLSDVDFVDEGPRGDESGDLAQREASGKDTTGLEEDPVNPGDFLLPEEPASWLVRPDDEGEPGHPVNPYAEVEIVTQDYDPDHPVVMVTEFARGTVFAQADPAAVAEHFARRFGPGDRCTVEVRDIRVLHRDRRSVLIAREQETGAEIALTARDLGFGMRDVSLGKIPPGMSRNLGVLVVDADTGLIQLSALPDIAATLTRLANTTPEPFTGTVVDAYSESLHVTLTPDGSRLRDDDPPITLEIRASDLPRRPVEMAVGRQVRVRLNNRARPEVSVDLDAPNLKVPTGPFQQVGATLVLRDTVTAQDVLGLYRAARDLPVAELVALHRAVETLLIRKLRPRGRIIDVTGYAGLQDQKRVSARVANVKERSVTIEIEGGIWATIPRSQLAWPGQQPPSLSADDRIDVVVTEVVPEQGKVSVTLRDPRTDPLARLAVGDVLSGAVIRSDRNGVIMTVADPGIDVFVPAREIELSGDEIGETFGHGSTLMARVIEVHRDQRRVIGSRWLRRVRLELPAEVSTIVDGPRGPAGKRLVHLVGGGANLRLEGGSLEVRWTDELSDFEIHQALRPLREVLHGSVAKIRVPYAGPLGAQGRDDLAVRFGSLARLDREEEDGRSAWLLTIIHPQALPVEEIISDIARRFPNRVRATGLHAVDGVRFQDARRAFVQGERERRGRNESASVLSFVRPWNYLDIGAGDTFDDVARRLWECGLWLQEPVWIAEDRVVEVSRRGVGMAP